MIPAALLGFSVGTVIAWWVVLRSLSHGAAELVSPFADDPVARDYSFLREWDVMQQVQTADPYVRRFFLDCE